MTKRFFAAAAMLALAACGGDKTADAPTTATAAQPLVAYEEFTLDNGLKVIFHIDRSDPVVAVALTAHVGSAREKPGRTGFAHLFEHLLFLESENLGPGGLDAMSARIGGSGANGSTSRDSTNYFQTVPNDALEKMIWAEADKIGWFINTVTDPVLAKEKQVVKNEKRQSYDNEPYGHTFEVISAALYPQDHPYNWEVIGSLADLDAATLDDVKEFYRAWYTPNNVVLAVAGDFDAAEARAWVEKYFGEIPRGPDIAPRTKQPATLSQTKLLFHEDSFAPLPELTMVWPTAPKHDADFYAVEALHLLLTDGKRAPLNEVLIDEDKLTSSVDAGGYNSELSGETMLSVRAFDGVDLDAVKAGIDKGFARFESNGIEQKDLDRVKTALEVSFYSGIGSVLGKAVALTDYEMFAGDASAINADVDKIRALTAADIMRVYEKYFKDRPFVATSFVPEGAGDLALDGSVRAEVTIEPIVQGAEDDVDASAAGDYARTPSSFDRSVEPAYGPKPQMKTPAIWEAALDNGLKVYGVEDRELPLVRFELSFDGGHRLDDPAKPGVANLLAEILDKGTAARTTAEFEEAVDALGAQIGVGVSDERFIIAGQALARNFDATLALVGEMLLTPRWDAEEFSLAKARVISDIQSQSADPNAIANRAYAKLTYGEGHILATSALGDEASVAALTLDDLKAWYGANLSPRAANFRVVGALAEADAVNALKRVVKNWTGGDVAYPALAGRTAPAASTVYFYDIPGAKQSVIRFGYPSLTVTDDDYYPAVVLNYRLGGGGFASRLMQELREGKGYTYGVGSQFAASALDGDFVIASAIRSNVTLEAALLIKQIIGDYGATFTDEDLDVTRSFLLKSKARSFETLGAKLGLLSNVADYGLPHDYVQRQNAVVEAMTVERIRELAGLYLRPDAMNYVVVGDAATQAARLEALGYGAPVMIGE